MSNKQVPYDFLLAGIRSLRIIVELSKGAKINGSLYRDSQYRKRSAFTLYFPVMGSQLRRV